MDFMEMSFKGAVGLVTGGLGWTIKQVVDHKSQLAAADEKFKAIQDSSQVSHEKLVSIEAKLDRLIERELDKAG